MFLSRLLWSRLFWSTMFWSRCSDLDCSDLDCSDPQCSDPDCSDLDCSDPDCSNPDLLIQNSELLISWCNTTRMCLEYLWVCGAQTLWQVCVGLWQGAAEAALLPACTAAVSHSGSIWQARAGGNDAGLYWGVDSDSTVINTIDKASCLVLCGSFIPSSGWKYYKYIWKLLYYWTKV